MTTITKDSAVFFNYTLTDENNDVIDQSPEGQPLGYLHGHRNIIPGLEAQLEGKSVGDKLHAVIEPADAYGEYVKEAVQEVPREHFQGIENIQPGMEFQAQSGEQMMRVTVKEVNGDTIIVDGNHPLAGKTLTFDVEIVNIRPATEEELAHGHLHGEGGVHH